MDTRTPIRTTADTTIHTTITTGRTARATTTTTATARTELKPITGPARRACNHSLSFSDRYVVALFCTGVELARAADLLMRVNDHLFPLRNPAYRTSKREKSSKHAGGEAKCLQGNS